MKSARHQLILLGFICQGLAWDDYVLPLLYTSLWFVCLRLPRNAIRLAPFSESALLVAGCAAGLVFGTLFGKSTHFFIGHGLTLLQAARLLRTLNRREKIFSIIMACFQIGVACTFLFDLRFIPVLAAIVLLLPRTFMELETDLSRETPAPPRPRPRFTAYAAIAGIMIVFFLGFPRGFLGTPIQAPLPGPADSGTLLDSVLDPARSGLANSRRVLLQIQGEQLGYLRCYALANFDGVKWTADEYERLRPIEPANANQRDRGLHRRVHVKQVAFLGRILPTDGRVVELTGKFFRRPRRNSQDAIQCEAMWNSANNVYEYRIDPQPETGPLPQWQRQRLTAFPAQTARLQDWLDKILEGVTNKVDQARRLESHLQRHFTYKLGAPELSRLNPVDDFVFNQREGHCERFAATLALLLRMKGVPSRVAIGYLPRSRSPVSDWYNVRFNDAHSWTEAYFDGLGWRQLDATPAATQRAPGWGIRDLLDTLDLAWSLHVVNFDSGTQRFLLNAAWQGLANLPEWARQHARGLGGSVLGLLVLMAWRRIPRWNRRADPARTRRRTQVLAEHYYGRMLRALARQGLHRQPHQTPLEFLHELGKGASPPLVDVQLITATFCETRYGNRPLSTSRQKEIEAALKRIQKPVDPQNSGCYLGAR